MYLAPLDRYLRLIVYSNHGQQEECLVKLSKVPLYADLAFYDLSNASYSRTIHQSICTNLWMVRGQQLGSCYAILQ
jgi:hypothetical protein